MATPSASSRRSHRAASWSTTSPSSPPHVAPATAAPERVNARLPWDSLCHASGHRPRPPCPSQTARPCVGLPCPVFASSVPARPSSPHRRYRFAKCMGTVHQPRSRVQRSGATHSRSCLTSRHRSTRDWPARVFAKWTQQLRKQSTFMLRRIQVTLLFNP